jgi:hypothetical protein
MKSYLLAVDAFEIDVAESKGQYLFLIVEKKKEMQGRRGKCFYLVQ